MVDEILKPDTHTPEDEDFKALLEKEGKVSFWLEPGQKVKAYVISITKDYVYIDLGGKTEGVIDVKEFKAGEEPLSIKEGDEIDAFFIHVKDGVKRFTTRLHGYSTIDLKGIRDAYHADLPVSGKVKSSIKGGFEVMVGGVKCFCPISQIDIKPNKEGETYIGETFPFKVIGFEEDGKNIVLSRRAVLEQERQEAIEEIKKTLFVGMELTGTIKSIHSFGIFVDLKGVDGLIPVSELGWDRNERPEDVYSRGQELIVKVIGIDWEKNRLTLSLKALKEDPWKNIEERYNVGDKIKGRVVKITSFGAFVSLEPGIEGLLHISNIEAGRRIKHPKEVLEEGQTIEAYILSINGEGRKISLSLENPYKEEPELPEEGELLDGVVEQVMPYGIFIKLDNGLTGLLPNSETGLPKGTNMKKAYPPGTRLKVGVIGVNREQRKITLSRVAAESIEERNMVDQHLNAAKGQSEGEKKLGSLGELLKIHLNRGS
ncbi:MAG: S1 RNA-binding domain-containing protein [Syntrophorhabdaceae bacterium]|nr:S1 RNA-binding domain-containing protein [Syntrophorhabdaceae bacterium]